MYSNKMTSRLSVVPWGMEYVPKELLDLAEKISRHNVESISWLPPDKNDKVQKEKMNWKKGLVMLQNMKFET